jgi:hypothetical protein
MLYRMLLLVKFHHLLVEVSQLLLQSYEGIVTVPLTTTTVVLLVPEVPLLPRIEERK